MPPWSHEICRPTLTEQMRGNTYFLSPPAKLSTTTELGTKAKKTARMRRGQVVVRGASLISQRRLSVMQNAFEVRHSRGKEALCTFSGLQLSRRRQRFICIRVALFNNTAKAAPCLAHLGLKSIAYSDLLYCHRSWKCLDSSSFIVHLKVS